MSFGYLPWPLYILLSLIVTFGILIYITKTFKENQRIFSLGLALTSIGVILTGLYKLTFQYEQLFSF